MGVIEIADGVGAEVLLDAVGVDAGAIGGAEVNLSIAAPLAAERSISVIVDDAAGLNDFSPGSCS